MNFRPIFLAALVTTFAGAALAQTVGTVGAANQDATSEPPGGAVSVMDERAEERFAAPASEVDRFLYGFSLLVCLPDGLSHEASVGTGTVMRPATFERYAMEAGFARVEILDALEHPFFRFYRLYP